MGKRTKGPGLVSRIRACLRKTDDQTQAPQQNHEPDQQASDDQTQQLQWTLEQTQLRYNELQDKHSKLMDLAARLLGLCAISSFTTFLTKSIWDGLTGRTRFALQCFIGLTLLVVFVVVVAINGLSITSSYRDRHLQDIAQLEQKQSTEEKTTSLIETLSVQIEVLRKSNLRVSIALYLMYLIYAVSLELLVLAILFPN